MSIVKDRRCVVTGKVPGHSRITAEQALRDAGAVVQSAVGRDTDVLVTGDAVGASKINKAKALGVEIVPWAQAFNGKTSGSKAPIAPRAPMPSVRQWAPMLCQAGELPAGGKWSYEIKWDGIRGTATIKDGGVYIQSRSGKTDLTGRYPEIAEELAGFHNCVLDGELVVLDNQLGLLPEDCDPDPVARFVVFDVLSEGDQETTARPLFERREILGLLLADGGCYVAPSPVFDDGEVVLDFARAHGLEGVVAKDRTSKYVEGGRGPAWLKIKIRNEQEFCVLGYTAGEGARAWAFGALILGYYEDGEMVYCGKVGTGFDDQKLGALAETMKPLYAGACPYVGMPRDVAKEATWLWPGLVVQVAFQKWTDDLRLWHPSFVRVRDDKDPKEVTRAA